MKPLYKLKCTGICKGPSLPIAGMGPGAKPLKTRPAVLIWQRRATGKGLFEPQLVKKQQTHMSDEIERKIISLFGLGVSYLDIAGQIAEIYGHEVSNASIRAITDKLIPKIKAW